MYVVYVMAKEITRIDEATMNEAVDRISDIPGVRSNTVQGVWATFRVTENFEGAISAALKSRGVVIYKVERADGFLSIALEDYADEL